MSTTNTFGLHLQPAAMLEQDLMDIYEIAAGKQALAMSQRLRCSVQLWDRGLYTCWDEKCVVTWWEQKGHVPQTHTSFHVSPCDQY